MKEQMCPSCRRGVHRYHQYDYMSRDRGDRVVLCRCPPCVKFVNSIGKPTQADFDRAREIDAEGYTVIREQLRLLREVEREIEEEDKCQD